MLIELIRLRMAGGPRLGDDQGRRPLAIALETGTQHKMLYRAPGPRAVLFAECNDQRAELLDEAMVLLY
jgi:hypothetical protein